MYLNDNLYLQIKKYEGIEDPMEQVKFIELIIDYYEKSTYESKNKKHCLDYWEHLRDIQYDIFFRYS